MMRLLWIKVFLFTLTGLGSQSLFAMEYKQPLFSLEFNIYGSGAEILLNDIPVYYHDDQGQTISQKPVPESIVDGENVLTIRSFPLDEDGGQYQKEAHVEAIISVREKDGLPNEGNPLLQIKLNPTNVVDHLLEGSVAEYGDQEAVVVSHEEKQTIAERRTAIQSPFPRWAWQDGQVIENTPENFNSLLAVYKEIWTALNDEDKTRVRQLYDSAAQEFSFAYHYQDVKQGHRIMNTGGLIGDDDWKLGSMKVRLEKRKYSLEVYAQGFLARLVDEKQNESLITYLNREARLISFQKFGFYKNKAGEWVMIR